MQSAEWNRWWNSKGQHDVTLLLWAVWNPLGPVPLDEYASYVPTIADILRRATTVGTELIEDADIDEVELQRERRQAALNLLATILAKFRTTPLGLPADSATDERTASVLFDWYEWSMQDLARGD